jgi:hypothetical protein
MTDPATPFSNSALLNDAAARAVRYLEGLPDRRVQPDAEAVRGLSAWDTPLPDGPCDPAAVLRLLDERGSPATMATTCGRFFGFVIGAALPVTVAANGSRPRDQNTGLNTVTPATAELGHIALGWLIDVL